MLKVFTMSVILMCSGQIFGAANQGLCDRPVGGGTNKITGYMLTQRGLESRKMSKNVTPYLFP